MTARLEAWAIALEKYYLKNWPKALDSAQAVERTIAKTNIQRAVDISALLDA